MVNIMTKIYTPAQSEAIINTIMDIEMGNNGYADIGLDETIVEGVKAAGYMVLFVVATAGGWTYRGFTKAAQEALAKEPFGVVINMK